MKAAVAGGAKREVRGGCFGAAVEAGDGGDRWQRQWRRGGGVSYFHFYTEFCVFPLVSARRRISAMPLANTNVSIQKVHVARNCYQ
jgi:hypothetical protein